MSLKKNPEQDPNQSSSANGLADLIKDMGDMSKNSTNDFVAMGDGKFSRNKLYTSGLGDCRATLLYFQHGRLRGGILTHFDTVLFELGNLVKIRELAEQHRLFRYNIQRGVLLVTNNDYGAPQHLEFIRGILPKMQIELVHYQSSLAGRIFIDPTTRTWGSYEHRTRAF